MRFNKLGQYVPVRTGKECIDRCDLCLGVCPFWKQNINEDFLAEKAFSHIKGIRYRVETGYVLNCYIGYSDQPLQRISGASGGLATWFLQQLIEEQIVNKVVAVTSNEDPKKLFKYDVMDTKEAVQQASRSCYYPVELSKVIDHILVNEGHYAVTGLPCFIKALRLAMARNRKLCQRIVVLVGLVCGHTKSKYFVEYLTALRGAEPDALVEVKFREKHKNRLANDYGIRLIIREKEQEKEEVIFWSDGISQAWRHEYFKPNPCYFCDDVFAETADVVFMDAWLPQCKLDYRGHNIVINRQEQFKSIWETALEAPNGNIQQLDVHKAIRSQRGSLSMKRQGLQFRLFLIRDYNLEYPYKRVTAAIAGNMIQRRLWKLKQNSSRLSYSVWCKDKDLVKFMLALKKIDREICFWETLLRFHQMIQEGRLGSALQKRCKHLY